LYGAFVWVRRVLNSQKWRFPARAVEELLVYDEEMEKWKSVIAARQARVERFRTLLVVYLFALSSNRGF
jgi:hypothetical protein